MNGRLRQVLLYMSAPPEADIRNLSRVITRVFLHEFYKFNNTGARMLDSIYPMTLKILQNDIFM